MKLALIAVSIAYMDNLRLEYLAKLISRKDVKLTARSGKRIRTGEKAQAPKRIGATSSDLQAANTSYKYLVLHNAPIYLTSA